MRLMELPKEFKAAIPVIERLKDAGFQAFFVGGSVRDTLLELPIHDVDIATSATPLEVKSLFEKTIDLGIEHGTILVRYAGEGYEITTFRTEADYADFRRPDHVTFVSSLSEDLKRRDFTINALALSEEGEVIDLFDGLTDLKNKRIKAVGSATERFNEDALRMMRAVRFSGQLDFILEKTTFEGIQEKRSLLKKIAVERIFVEFSKLLKSAHRASGIHILIESELYRYCPEMAAFEAALSQMARLNAIKSSLEATVWSLLCFFQHLSEEEIHHFLRTWKASNELIKQVSAVSEALRSFSEKDDLDSFELYGLGAEQFSIFAEALILLGISEEKRFHLEKAYAELPIHSRKELILNGPFLMAETSLKPGPQFGALIEEAEKLVVEQKIENNTKSLRDFLAEKGLS